VLLEEQVAKYPESSVPGTVMIKCHEVIAGQNIALLHRIHVVTNFDSTKAEEDPL
jgi:hypothetical protein